MSGLLGLEVGLGPPGGAPHVLGVPNRAMGDPGLYAHTRGPVMGPAVRWTREREKVIKWIG